MPAHYRPAQYSPAHYSPAQNTPSASPAASAAPISSQATSSSGAIVFGPRICSTVCACVQTMWVGAACLGLTLFKKRKAMLNRLLGRRPAAPSEV